MPGPSAGRYCQPVRTTLAPITWASGVGPSPRSSANSLTDRPLVKIAPAPDRSSSRSCARSVSSTPSIDDGVGLRLAVAAVQEAHRRLVVVVEIEHRDRRLDL